MEPFPYPDSYNYAKTHELLNREWFGDRDDIREVLDRANQDAWERVARNRNSYPADVRDAIQSYIVKPYTLRDISDKEMELIDEKKKERISLRFADAWEEKKKTLPTRPLNDADTANDDAWLSLTAAKVGLDRYTATRKYQVYVTTDNLLKTHEEKVKVAENEYAQTSKEVAYQDDKFRDAQKHDFYKNWVCEL